jgi:hypothetical protein
MYRQKRFQGRHGKTGGEEAIFLKFPANRVSKNLPTKGVGKHESRIGVAKSANVNQKTLYHPKLDPKHSTLARSPTAK